MNAKNAMPDDHIPTSELAKKYTDLNGKQIAALLSRKNHPCLRDSRNNIYWKREGVETIIERHIGEMKLWDSNKVYPFPEKEKFSQVVSEFKKQHNQFWGTI